MNKIKKHFSWLWSLVLSFITQVSSLGDFFMTPVFNFPNGRFAFAGVSNGADRKRRSNRLHISKRARRRNRK